MKAQRQDARDAVLERLGARVRADVTGEVSERASLAGRDRLVAALEDRQTRRPWRAVAFGGAGLAAVAAAALIVATRLHAPATQAWSASNAVTADGGWVSTARPDSSATLTFAEGVRLELAGGSRGRVVEATPTRARVVLEEGKAHLNGEAHPRVAFLLEAGPYALEGQGAAFDVAWSGADATLDVRVASGTVSVRGPAAEKGIALVADQRLEARARDGAITVERATDGSEDAGTVHGAAEDLELPATPGSATAPAGSAAARGRGGASTMSWSKRVAAGDYDGVLREAEARGLDASIQHGTLSDVAALADAARYAGKPAIAKKALVAERTRFRGSAEARTAAFLLGRLAEDADGDARAATQWYDRYLAEAPRGPLASEALGRKMITTARVSGPDAAKPIAEEYLRRYPNGAYASVARQYAP